jgi:hypothetical protein
VQIYLPIAELPVSMFLILGMSVAIGFISGMFGVGGGFLMTPLLVFLGVPATVAVATGAAQIVASSTTGALAYWRRRAIDLKLGSVLLIGGLIGTAMGVWFFNVLRRAGQFDVVLVLSYITVLGTVGGLMLVESLRSILKSRKGPIVRRRKGGQHPWYAKLPFRTRFPRSGLYMSILPPLALGLFIGFAGAVLGIGGGFIVIPVLIYLLRVPSALVVGTTQLQILFTMLVATILHAVLSQTVDIVLALLLIVGSVIGAQFGSRAGQKLKGEQFRLLLALLVCGVAVRFAADVVVRPSEPYSLIVIERR